MGELKIAWELGATVVRPGQTLVVCSPHRLSAMQADEIKQRIAARLPGVEVCLLPEVSQVLVYEADDDGSTVDTSS
ncbi:hypothetical protein [Nonomuraea sp. NPDC049758]|uniref:hypothetical protein n=1 Tax=Nonomuraea sp. NPDC049758 TaxID=3154360 RepID=UPI00341F6DB2